MVLSGIVTGNATWGKSPSFDCRTARTLCILRRSKRPLRATGQESSHDPEAEILHHPRPRSGSGVEFFVNVLGFTVQTDQPMGPGLRWIEVRPPRTETGIALFTPPGLEDRIGTFTGLSFECDDVQKTFEELSAKGVEFAKPPKAESWGVAAIMKDSEGNQIVLSSSN
jgi:predicted enzyme related to lactoylglutathione lyase